jgi:hypothetical protein
MDKKTIVRMLNEIRNIAGEASLTDTFSKGGATLVKHYNLCLKFARDKSFLGENTIFTELVENSNMDEIGIAASLLSAYLKDYERQD